MNKNNLIRFGALAQTIFEMRENFEIMEVSPRLVGISVRVPIGKPLFDPQSPIGPDLAWDVVNLKKFGDSESHQYIWAAYSKRANTLVISEDHETKAPGDTGRKSFLDLGMWLRFRRLIIGTIKAPFSAQPQT